MDKTQEIKDKYKSLMFKMDFREAVKKKFVKAESTINQNYFKHWVIPIEYHSIILNMLDEQIKSETRVKNILVIHYERISK
jgi:hypothetical protein